MLNTPQVPGPKSHPRKLVLLILLWLFLAAVLGLVRKGEEQEGKGVVVETGPQQGWVGSEMESWDEISALKKGMSTNEE